MFLQEQIPHFSDSLFSPSDMFEIRTRLYSLRPVTITAISQGAVGTWLTLPDSHWDNTSARKLLRDHFRKSEQHRLSSENILKPSLRKWRGWNLQTGSMAWGKKSKQSLLLWNVTCSKLLMAQITQGERHGSWCSKLKRDAEVLHSLWTSSRK